MARVEIKGLSIGVVQDRNGNVLSGITFTCSATVYAAATGATTLTGAQLASTAPDGELPGWLEPGTVTITIPLTGKTVTFEAGTDVTQAELDAVENRAAAIEVGLELNVHSFAGIDFTGVADSTAALQAAILAASNAGVTSGRSAGTLSASLSTGAAIAALPVAALSAPVGEGSLIAVKSGANTQYWTVTANAATGATSLPVASQTPGFAYPSGSTVTVTVQVKLSGFTSRDVLLSDTLLHYRNVWVDAGKARFIKRTNGSSMLRTPLTTSPATWAATGSTNGTNQLTILTNRRAFVVGRTVTDAAGKIPAGTTILSMNWTTNVATLSAAAAAGASSGAMTLTGTTYYGTGQNIRLTGGIWDPNGKTCVGGILAPIYAENYLYEEATVRLGNLSGADWAIKHGGRVGRVTRCNILGGELVTADGIHTFHGQNLAVDNNYAESGDDPFPVGQEPGSIFMLADPDPISNVVLTSNRCKSKRGFGVSVFVGYKTAQNVGPDPNHAVTNVVYDGLVGTSGELSNGGIRVVDLNLPAPGAHLISGVAARGVALALGSATHDGANPYVVQVDSATDVAIDAGLDWTNPTGPTLSALLSIAAPITSLPIVALPSALVLGANVMLADNAGHYQVWTVSAATAAGATSLPVSSQTPNFTFPAGTPVTAMFNRERARQTYGLRTTIRTPKRGAPLPDLRGNVRRAAIVSGATVERDTFRIFDDFADSAVAAPWQTRVGSDPACAVAILANQPSGVLVLTPGAANTSGVAATDGATLDRPALNFKVSPVAFYGSLVLEARVKLTQIGSIIANIAFTDQNTAIGVPLNSTGSGPHSTRPNAVGFCYDTASNVSAVTGARGWWGVGAKSSVETGMDLNAVPIGGSYATWVQLRVEIDWLGTATFEIDGRVVGILPNAVDPNIALTPVIAVVDRPLSATRGALHVDNILVEQLRG